MSDSTVTLAVLFFLSSILFIQPLPFHVRLPIIGWPIDLMTAPILAIILILLCAPQTIGTSQVCDGIDDIPNIFISLVFMAITPDGETNVRELYLYFNFPLAAVTTLLPQTPSHRRKSKRRRREKKKGIGMEKGPQGGEKPESESTPLLHVDYKKALGFGSLGTVVYEGLFQGRAVAVKCLPQNFVTLAIHEISILQQSDDHPNVIRYFCHQKSHPNFIELALELCPASLADIIENLHGNRSGSGNGREEEWRAIAQGFDAKKAMKQIASGLKHLHELGLVHRDIKPQNILISSSSSLGGKYRMLISDFGLCKKLDADQSSFSLTTNGAMAAGTAGWRAPEMLCEDDELDELSAGEDPGISSRRGEATTINGTSPSGTTTQTNPLTRSVDIELDERSTGDDYISSRGSQASTINGASSGATTKPRLTKSIDIFALGCLFYYILTEGKHPFGDRFHREANIIKDNKNLSPLRSNKEAYDLITRMLYPQPLQRPDIETCLLHPFFWDPAIRLGFLRDVSDRFEVMCKDPPMDKALIRLERDAKTIVGSDWHRTLDPSSDQIFIRDLRKSRKYDGSSVRDLLRALRNKKNHYQDLPDDVKSQLGPMPEGFLAYFTGRYPKLLIYVHEVVQDTGLYHESTFKSYFELPES